VDPLSSLTYYRRHKRQALLLASIVVLATLGLYATVGMMTPIRDHMSYITLGPLTRFSMVYPEYDRSLDPAIVSQIRANPGVARVIPENGLGLFFNVPSLAANRDLRVGDTVGRAVVELDRLIPTELVVAGILRPRSEQVLPSGRDSMLIGFASYEYLESHELCSSETVSLFVIPREGRKAELDTWLEESAEAMGTTVWTYAVASHVLGRASQGLFLMIAVVESIIAAVAAIALAALNTIFFGQRKDEFGVLHALGKGRPWLILRTVKETATVAGLAWLIGAAVCVAGLLLAQANIYAPKGLTMDFLNPAPWLFTLPIPLAVVAASAGTIAWALSRLDPVAVIERR
jgi:hypothetical protein